MAYDPEARETGNSAMIIGIIVLVLLVGGALAYFATRPGDAPGPDVVVDQNPPASSTTVIENNQPAPAPGSDTVVVQPPANVETKSETTVTTGETSKDAPAANAPAADAPASNAPSSP